MRAWLFLGIGESNSAIASFVEGERWGLAEHIQNEQAQVSLYFWENGGWSLREIFKGRFEDFDFEKLSFDRVVLSPGIDPRRSFVEGLASREIRELDLFCEHYRYPTVVITGSVGKSTFTTRLGYLLASGRRPASVFVGGNLGDACFRLFHRSPLPELAVLEVSSFMAERLRRARFDWGVLLNLYPNHLDRYNSLQDYYRAKWGLLERSATKFFPKDVENVLSLHSDLEFSQEESSLFLLQHVAQRVDPQLVEIDLKRLPSLAHRQEFWMASDGRAYVNDSKSTTVQSTLAALRQFQPRFERIHLILGGKDKGDDFSRLLKILRSSDSVWIYGVSAEKIQNDLKSFSGTIEKRERFSDLMAACRQALKMGELLLLSPGATSWDQFANFEERGRQFWKLVGRPAY